jgi:hypothetical protein
VSQGLVDGGFHIGCVIGRGNMQEADEAGGRMPPWAPRNAPSPQDGPAQPIDTGGGTRAMQRFAREVRIMRRLRHPDLTRLIAGGTGARTLESSSWTAQPTPRFSPHLPSQGPRHSA